MAAHPAPSAFEQRTNGTYEALMWALARPGVPRHLPAPGLAGIIESLVDRECAVYCDTEETAQFAHRTGAEIVAPGAADHLFLSQACAADFPHQLRQGSDMYPEDGATLVMPATFGQGGTLRLTGPGVKDHVTLQLSGVPDGFWAERQRVMRYPMGFEIFLLQGDQVVGLPRSTIVEGL